MSEVKRYTFDEICESQDFNHEETFILASEYEKLKAQLEKAEIVLKFYANHLNWNYCPTGDEDTRIEGDSDIPDGLCENRGGKRAREYFKEKEQK